MLLFQFLEYTHVNLWTLGFCRKKGTFDLLRAAAAAV